MTDSEQTKETAADFIARIQKQIVAGNYIFRGTTIEVKSIQSTLYRWAIKKGILNEEIKDYQPSDIEKKIIDKAGKHFIDGASNIEILTELRHYGGNVNLIDFSRDLNVALFFACNGDYAEDGELILFNTKNLQNDVDHETLLKESKDQVAILEPAQTQTSRVRVIAQSSIFVYTNKGYIDKGRVETIIVPEDMKIKISDHIKKLHDVHAETIYNDLPGFIENEENPKTIADYKAIEVNLKDNIHNNRGLARHSSVKQDKTIADYDKAIKINPQNADAYASRGFAKYDLGKYKEAIIDYDQAIAINPHDADTYFDRGFAKANLDKYVEAIIDYNQAIEINPKGADYYCFRGLAKSSLDKHEDAIADYNKAIEIDLKNDYYYHNRGFSKLELTRYEEAIADYNRAIAIDSKNADSYYFRGLAKSNLEKYEEAITDFNQAITINLQDAVAYVDRGLAKSDLGSYKEAIADFNQAIAIDPQYANAYYFRGVTKTILGDEKGAKKDFAKAKELEKKKESKKKEEDKNNSDKKEEGKKNPEKNNDKKKKDKEIR
jgi:tetratricopeptide (TPR) repeat protein